jgi:hypothetical protein
MSALTHASGMSASPIDASVWDCAEHTMANVSANQTQHLDCVVDIIELMKLSKKQAILFWIKQTTTPNGKAIFAKASTTTPKYDLVKKQPHILDNYLFNKLQPHMPGLLDLPGYTTHKITAHDCK